MLCELRFGRLDELGVVVKQRHQKVDTRGSGENKKSNHKNERESCRYLITVRKHSARQNHRLKFVSQAGSFQRTQVRLKTDSRQDARNRQRTIRQRNARKRPST